MCTRQLSRIQHRRRIALPASLQKRLNIQLCIPVDRLVFCNRVLQNSNRNLSKTIEKITFRVYLSSFSKIFCHSNQSMLASHTPINVSTETRLSASYLNFFLDILTPMDKLKLEYVTMVMISTLNYNFSAVTYSLSNLMVKSIRYDCAFALYSDFINKLVFYTPKLLQQINEKV